MNAFNKCQAGAAKPASFLSLGKLMILCPEEILEKYKCKSSASQQFHLGESSSCQLMNGREKLSVCACAGACVRVSIRDNEKRREETTQRNKEYVGVCIGL